MTLWHGYIAGQDIALQAGEKAIIWNLLNTYGQDDSSPQPARRLVWRDNLAGDKRIIEAVFNPDMLAISQFRPALADALGLAPADIDVNTAQNKYVMLPTNIVTFKYEPKTTNRFRLALFGGTSATWAQSLVEVIGYMLTDIEDWESND